MEIAILFYFTKLPKPNEISSRFNRMETEKEFNKFPFFLQFLHSHICITSYVHSSQSIGTFIIPLARIEVIQSVKLSLIAK